jgi:hypothetical protein
MGLLPNWQDRVQPNTGLGKGTPGNMQDLGGLNDKDATADPPPNTSYGKHQPVGREDNRKNNVC